MIDRFLAWLGAGVVTAGVSAAMIAGAGHALADDGPTSGNGSGTSSVTFQVLSSGACDGPPPPPPPTQPAQPLSLVWESAGRAIRRPFALPRHAPASKTTSPRSSVVRTRPCKCAP